MCVCVCMCVCMCVCVRACVYVCVRVCVRENDKSLPYFSFLPSHHQGGVGLQYYPKNKMWFDRVLSIGLVSTS